MKIMYVLVVLACFFFEMLMYGLSRYLYGFFWTASLCNHLDAIGNCLDFRWDLVVGAIGLLGVKIIVTFLFLIILSKTKKVSPALLAVLSYLFLIFSFHFGGIPIKQLNDLSGWLEVANLYGILAASISLLFILASSVFYFIKNKKQIKI